MNHDDFEYSLRELIPSQHNKRREAARSLKHGTIRLDGLGQDECFTCLHCKLLVTANSWVSGVNNRNHCPVCLHSRHLDHFTPGDRLSSCMGVMEPLALTVKRSLKKYTSNPGELMLVHRCTACGKIAINRIAADDDTQTIWGLYQNSLTFTKRERLVLSQAGIEVLTWQQRSLVSARLFGRKDVDP